MAGKFVPPTASKITTSQEDIDRILKGIDQRFGLQQEEVPTSEETKTEQGMSQLEQLAADLPVRGAKEGGRKMREGWLPWLGAGAARITGGLLSAPGGFAGAGISGTAEALAQKIESPDPVDAGAVAIESGLGAIPFGKIVKGIKPAISIGGQMAANAGRMAGYIEGGNMLRRMYYEGDPLPDTLGELAMDVGTTAVGAKLANWHPKFDSFAGTQGRTVRSITDDLAGAIEQNTGTIAEPTLIKTKTGGAIPQSQSKVAVEAGPTLTRPDSRTLGGLRVASPDAGNLGKSGRNVELPQDPMAYAQIVNARSVEPGKLPLALQMQLDAIDARPSKVPHEWLDAAGKPITPQAEAMVAHEAKTKEVAKRNLMDKFYAAQETKPAEKLAKAEDAANREAMRTDLGGTNVGKVRVGVEKAAQAANKERVDAAKAHTQATDMLAKEETQRNAQAAIDKALETMEPGRPVVTEVSASVPTSTGKQTLRQSFTEKQADDFEGVDIDVPMPPSRGSAPVAAKPVIPKTDPDTVAMTIYPTEFAAMHALAGSGKSGGSVQRMSRGKWRVVYGKTEVPKATPVPETPAPKPSTPEQKAANDIAKQETAAGVSYAGTERRGAGRVTSAAEDQKYKIQRELEIQKNKAAAAEAPARAAENKAKIEGELNAGPSNPGDSALRQHEPPATKPPQEPPPAAPVPAKPKPAPKKPSGGATTPAPTKKPMSKREIDAVTREDVAKWPAREILEAKHKYPKDKRLQTILSDELKVRADKIRADKLAQKPVEAPKVAGDVPVAPKAPETPVAPAKAVPKAPTKGFEGPDRIVEAKPANVKPQPQAPKADPIGPTPTKVTVDLTGAKDSKEVKNRVVNEIQKYRAQVQKAIDDRGVDEKGQYTYPTPLPKSLAIEVPNGPTYTFKPELEQLDNALGVFKKGAKITGARENTSVSSKVTADDALKGIVDKAERPTHVKVNTGYGSNFNAEAGSAPSVKLPISPEKKGAAPIRAKKSPIGGPPEGVKAKEQPSPLAPKAEAPAADINDLVLQEKQAWDKYFELKQAKAPEADIRAAGKAAGEIRAQLAQAAKNAEASGKPVPGYAQQTANRRAVRPTPPKGKGPTNEDISKLPPDQQEVALQKIVDDFGKNNGKGKGTIVGGGFGSLQELYERDPEMFSRVGLSAAGALAGAASTPDDPWGGAILGGAAGFYGPSVFRVMRRRIASHPPGSPARDQLEKSLGETTKGWIVGAVNTLPDFFRASYLARIPNLIFNAWAGPYGAAMMGALETALDGDRRGWKALRLLGQMKMTKAGVPLPRFLKDWAGPAMKEADRRVFDARERGDVSPDLKPGIATKVITTPATAMTAGDIAARGILMEAGFSELEARRFTLTSEPMSKYAEGVGNFRRTGGWWGKMMLPFYRTAANQIEQSLLRTPIGNTLRKKWRMAPTSTKQLAIQSGITGVVGIGSFALGAEIDPKYAPYVIKFVNNFMGPYGATASAAFIMGVASKKTSNPLTAVPKGLATFITTGTPLPTSDALVEWAKFAEGAATGNFRPPYGLVPPILSSKESFSAPAAMRYAAGDRQWYRPTKNEYGPFVLAADNPQLKPKPKTEHQRKLEAIRETRARRRREAKEKAGG